MQIEIPQKIMHILEKTNQAGYRTHIVGECVRDSLLGKIPDNWKIITSATPEQVREVFGKTLDTDIQNGTITIIQENIAGYLGRTSDFTINAMSYHPEEGLLIAFTGRSDIRTGIIRTVGDPNGYFTDYTLQIMKAFRLAAQFGFQIEQKTKNAIKEHAQDLKKISTEQIKEELTKIICSPHPEILETMYELGVTAQILPEFDRLMETTQNTPYHYTDVGHHTITVMQNVSPSKEMRYAALLHDIGKPLCKTTDADGIDHFKTHAVVGEPIAEGILKRLGMNDKMIENVCRLVKWHDFGIEGNLTEAGFRRGISKMGIEHFPEYLEIRRADIAGQSDYKKEWKLGIVNDMIQMYNRTIEESKKLTVKDLAINGRDLQALGVSTGPQMGQIMNQLLDIAREDPSKNEPEVLKAEAKKLAAQRRMEKSLKERQKTAKQHSHKSKPKREPHIVKEHQEK